jgi:hypothetical protein
VPPLPSSGASLFDSLSAGGAYRRAPGPLDPIETVRVTQGRLLASTRGAQVTSQAQLSRLLAHYQLLRPPVTPGQPSDTDDAVSMIVTTGVPTVLSFFPSGANPTIRYGLATWYEWVFGVEITLTPAFAYPAAGPADIPLTVGICDIVLAASSVYNSDVGCTVRVIGETNPAKGATVRLVILPCDTTGNGTQHYLPIARNTGINLTVGVPPPSLHSCIGGYLPSCCRHRHDRRHRPTSDCARHRLVRSLWRGETSNCDFRGAWP